VGEVVEVKPLRCPRCGRSSNEVEMLAEVPVRGVWTAVVAGVDPGVIHLRAIDVQTEPGITVQLTCRRATGGCGHEWRTERTWELSRDPAD
jgi:hypothetical protein